MVANDFLNSSELKKIGLGGFEPPTPCPPDMYAKPLRYSPILLYDTTKETYHTTLICVNRTYSTTFCLS